jgi:hypothetical protein
MWELAFEFHLSAEEAPCFGGFGYSNLAPVTSQAPAGPGVAGFTGAAQASSSIARASSAGFVIIGQ